MADYLDHDVALPFIHETLKAAVETKKMFSRVKESYSSDSLDISTVQKL